MSKAGAILGFNKKFFVGANAFALAIFAASNLIYASPRSIQSSSPSPSFEVATIKPNHSNESGHRDNFTRGKYMGRNVTVKSLIERAYGVSDYQLIGAPAWTSSDAFDIDAKMEDSAAAEMLKLPPAERTEQIKLIFQAFLADRFNLKIARETRELPIYALVVAKNGPKLTPSKLPPLGSPSATPAQQATRGTDVTGKGLESTAVAKGVTLSQLVAILARDPELAGRVVQDETGLKGEYDFTLQWTRDNLSAGDGAISADSSIKDASGPSLFTALQQQLGLKLEPKKGPVDTIIIQHIEKPSEN
jgi:uncharacterized protein (TIGR03435 family)